MASVGEMVKISRRYVPRRFWLVRLLSVAAVALFLYLLQTVLVPALPTPYDARLISLSLLFASLAVSLNLINGITGQFSIGHAAFFLVGAYGSSRLTLSYFETQPLVAGVWIFVVAIIGGLMAAVAGFVVGLPSLRLRGDYLAIVTLGFGEIARIFVINQTGRGSSIAGLDLGGSFGLPGIPLMTDVWHFALLLIFTVLVSRNMLQTSHGLAFLAVREDELAAEATGVNTTKTKVTAFVLGAALAGIAGAFFAHFEGFITPQHFDMNVSFIILTMVVVGGTGSITGAALAGIALKLLEEALRKLPEISAIDLLGYLIAAACLLLLMTALRRNRPARNSAPWLAVLSLAALAAGVAAVAKGFSIGGAVSAFLFTTGGLAALAVLGGLPLGLMKYREDPFRVTLKALGYTGCVGMLFAAYLVWNVNASVVIRVGIGLILVGAAASLLGYRAGRASLALFGMLVAGLLGVVVLQPAVSTLLHAIPFVEENLKETMYSPSNLRMAVFAVSLVIVMLVRPQGLLGHHEFSWSFLGKSLGMKTKETAIHS
jgi:branched-chain amino acid transport system permease protein